MNWCYAPTRLSNDTASVHCGARRQPDGRKRAWGRDPTTLLARADEVIE